MLITVTSNDGAQSSAARRVATDIVRQLHNSPYVAQVMSPWTASPSASASLISKDGKTGLIVAGITGGENDAPKHAKVLSETLVHDRDGVTVRAGGDAITYAQVIDQTEKDLNLMEAIAIPLSFLVLVWVFGGVGGGRASHSGRRSLPFSGRWRCCAQSALSPRSRSSR